MAKILYIIASHTSPAQVGRLVNRLLRTTPDAQVLIHHDGSKPPLIHTDLWAGGGGGDLAERVLILPNPVPVQWGGFSVVDLELRCLDWARQNEVPFDWLVLLSGQDYPLQPLHRLSHLFDHTPYDGFLQYFPAHSPPPQQWNWDASLSLERYWFRYYSVPPQCKWLFRKLYRPVNWNPWLRLKGGRFGAKIARRRLSPLFNESLQCYAGSQWHSLNRRCIDYIHQVVHSRPEIVDYYRHTMVPDESFFQTILLNNPDLSLCNDNLRYIVWRSPYPGIMESADFDAMIASGKYFGRKFDPAVDADILDRLDAHLQVLQH